MTKILTILALAIIGLATDVGGCTIPPCQSTHNSVSKISVMESKKCTKCGEVKLLSDYIKKSNSLYKLRERCKICTSKIELEYRRSKGGLLNKMYNSQVASSKKRNHPKPTYSTQELKDWCFSQKLFHELYDSWKAKRYDKWLIPSCDRTDDLQGYSLSRLVLTTWGENKVKGEDDRKTGIDTRMCKAVISINIETGTKKEYYSASIASN